MSEILITGGAGFVGGNFCRYMTDKYPEDNFTCLDALTYAADVGSIAPLSDKPNFTFVKGEDRKGISPIRNA